MPARDTRTSSGPSARACPRAWISDCRCSRATQMPFARGPKSTKPKVPSTRLIFLHTHARVLRIRDSRFSFRPRLRFNPFSARATGPPAAPRASLSNEHAHVRFTMGATTSRCEEAEAEPVQEVRSAVRCLRLQVSISFLPVSFAVQAGTGKKEALDGRPNLPVPLPIFRLRSKSPLPRSRRSPPPTSRCAPAPRVNALSQNPAIEALPSPRLFSFPRLYPKALSPLSDLRPSSPSRTDRNRAFRPPLPPDESSEALLHSLQRVPQVRALAPGAVDATPTNHDGCCWLPKNSALTNIFPPAPPTFSSLSQVQSAEG